MADVTLAIEDTEEDEEVVDEKDEKEDEEVEVKVYLISGNKLYLLIKVIK